MTEVRYRIEGESGKRSKLVIIAVACLVALVLAGGGTLAYLSTQTNTESNVFTSGNIAAQLIEPDWDTNTNPDGQTGEQVAEKMLPGVTALKDPQIKNTSLTDKNVEEDEWVAIRLSFQKSADGTADNWIDMTADDMTALYVGLMMAADGASPAAGLQVAADWGSPVNVAANITDTIKPNEFVYVYNSKVGTEAGIDDVSDPIFDSVGINASAGQDTWTSGTPTMAQYMNWLNAAGGSNGHFQIKVEGAAIQATGFTDAAAATKPLLTTFGYTVTS